MKKPKLNYFFAVALVAICGLSCIPIAFAADHRSLDDWFYDVNGDPLNDWLLGFGNPEFSIYPLFDRYFEFTPIWDTDYSGYVTDKETKDGYHEITVYIQARNIPFIFGKDGFGWIVDGILDFCFLKINFDINTEIWTGVLVDFGLDDDGYDDKGNILLPSINAIDIPGTYGVYLKSMFFTAQGSGEFFVNWEEHQIGDAVKVKCNQVGLVKPDEYVWPCEITFIH